MRKPFRMVEKQYREAKTHENREKQSIRGLKK